MTYLEKVKYKYGLISYFIFFLLGGSFVTLFVVGIAANKFNLDKDTLMGVITGNELIDGYEQAYYYIMSFSNFLVYVITLSVVLVFVYKFFLNDIKEFIKNIGSNLSNVLLVSLLFLVTKTVIENFVLKYSPVSENQTQIIDMVSSKYGIYMIITTVILAPIVEELAYRKCLFSLLGDYKPIYSLIVSTIIFTLFHVMSTDGSFIEILIVSIPYAFASLFLGSYYLKSKQNVTPVILVHAINNLIGVVAILMS